MIMDPEQLLSSVKKDVRSLLISSKHGLSPEQLRKDYYSMLGHPMPLKALGFRSVMDMVKEMPDAVRLDYNLDGTIVLKAIGNNTTSGIVELVSKQRDSKHKSKSKSGSMGWFSSHSLHRQNSYVLPHRAHTPPALPAHLRSQLRQLLVHGPITLSELERCYAVRFGRPLCVLHYGFYSIAEMLAAASDIITVKQTRMGSQLVLKTEITPVKQILNSTAAFSKQSAGISRVSTNTNSVPREIAVLSNVQPEAHQKLQDTAAIKVPENLSEPSTYVMQEELFEKSIAKLEEEFRKRITESGDAGTVSAEIKEKLRKVVSEHSQGMAIHHLPAEYKKLYGEDLPLAQCGFLNVTEMVGALSDTFYLQPSTGEGEKHLIITELKPNDQPAWSLNPSTEGHYFSCYETAWECQHDEGESMNSQSDAKIEITNNVIHQIVDSFPVTSLSHGPKIPLDALLCQKLKPPTHRRERELVPVLVEKIQSPSHFYIRFNEAREAHILENMMFEMRSCYSCPEIAERYWLPDSYMRPGQVCCVAPGDMWFYRVVIHRVLSATEVEVYYVDFGDLTVVSRNRLRFLKSCYTELPVQAVPSALVGVKPVKGIWSKEAISSFQKLCYDRTLVAAVQNYQDDFLLLFLCDTNTEEDRYIHSILKADGHAVACAAENTLVSQQVSPVNLYFGDGQLDEVKEHFTAVTTSSLGLPNGQNLTQQLQPDASTVHSQLLTDGVENQHHSRDMDLLDLPELEVIDVIQGEKPNQFEALLSRDPASFGNWDQEWMDNDSVDKQSKLLKNGQDEAVNTGLLSPVPSVKADSKTQSVLESKHTPKPPLTLHMHRDQTPGLIRSSSTHTDMSAESFQPLSSSLMFSMYSSGDRPSQEALFLRHTSPLALGASARMAAGPSLFQWYTQTGLSKPTIPEVMSTHGPEPDKHDC